MSTPPARSGTDTVTPRFLREIAVVVLALVGFSLWLRVYEVVAPTLVQIGNDVVGGDDVGVPFNLLLVGGANAAVLLAFALAFTLAYASTRELDIGTDVPGREDRVDVATATIVPVALVVGASVIASASGNGLPALLSRSVAEDGALEPIVAITFLALVTLVPIAVLVNHVLVQDSLRAAFGPRHGILLTIGIAAFLVDDPELLAVRVPFGRVMGLALAVACLALAVVGTDVFESDYLSVLAWVPFAVILVLFGVSWVVSITSIAGAFLALAGLLTLAVAAATYERTRSLLVPAIAYVAFTLTIDVLVYGMETGVLPS